jgi:tripartite ATP-independent transporter DctP family solute receptor
MAGLDFRFRQFHNQASTSPLHRILVSMWVAVGRQTGGRVLTDVWAENGRISGSDPAALQMVVKGEIEFFTLMGGLLAPLIPLADFQSVPFAFRDAAHALAVSDGPLGSLLKEEMKRKGLHGFKRMTFDNGMRQIGTRTRPIHRLEDLKGLTVRVPDGTAFLETFEALGAVPIAINVNGILGALESGRVDAQENALAVMEVFRLDRAQRYISLTNHMWSGFNLMAHLPTWERLPQDVQSVIEREAQVAILAQRAEQETFNTSVRATFEARGLVFTTIDQAPFRKALAPVYGRWRRKIGEAAWELLEQEVGVLG